MGLLRSTMLIGQIVLGCGFLVGIVAADPVSDLLQQSLQPRLAASTELQVEDRDVPLAVAEFYAARHWAPLWNNKRFTVLLNEIANLYTDGLNPDDYDLPALKQLQNLGTDPARLAKREKLATRAYLLALIQLYHGKVDPVKLDAHWNFDTRSIDPEQGLKLALEAVENNRIEDIFERARPTLPQYGALRTALANLRQTALAGGWPLVPTGSPLKPGADDPRVPILRQRLAAVGLLSISPDQTTIYDPATVHAVQRFQNESYLKTDGIVGPETLRELNVPIEQRIGQLRANLERMRWFLGHIKGNFVLVDIAGYHVYYLHDNKPLWKSRVQIGKSYRQTPIFKSEITYITLNPTWTVPPTILREDSLPAIRHSLTYLSRNHIRVLNTHGQILSPRSINWKHPGKITLRQDAGPDNSLGQLVLRFPNPYDVYMHDTPHQSLFSSKQRAFSSGCIRVENILELAVLLFNDPETWSRQELDTALATGKTRNISLHQATPVLIAYWTVDVAQDGYVSFRPDIYDQDAKILKALDDRMP
ncbi:MAG: L,D-transpeptidase family protein [Pseudomonadales bacterium]|nr:L,D-transpeptidase family protein [Pseudomonadales bacterium]